jgi:FMN phosphatase YigB (HAD superfamily)
VTSLIQESFDLKFYKFWEAAKNVLEDASSGQTFSAQVIVFIEDSYKNVLEDASSGQTFSTQVVVFIEDSYKNVLEDASSGQTFSAQVIVFIEDSYKNVLEDASSGQTFSTQVVVSIEDSYKNELVLVLFVRACSSHSSDSNQRTNEQILIEFDIDGFHQHLPPYSKVYAVYPNI